MTFDAWFKFHEDDEVTSHPTTMRVYARLLRNPDIFFTPQDVKIWVLAEQLHTSRERVQKALDQLVERGYAVEHARAGKRVRRFILTRVRVIGVPNGSCPNA